MLVEMEDACLKAFCVAGDLHGWLESRYFTEATQEEGVSNCFL
jgi:hypothetical protein